jgi:hypothetical protein
MKPLLEVGGARHTALPSQRQTLLQTYAWEYIRCDIRGEDEDGGSLIFLFSPSIYFIYANDPEFFY